MRQPLTTLLLLLAGAGAAVSPSFAQSFATPPKDGADAGWTRSDVRRYWPRERTRRSSYDRRDRSIDGWFEVRGGFYDAEDVSANDWTLGFKVSGRVVPSVSAGIAADLHRRSDAQRTITSQYVDATGHTVTTTSTSLQAESNLVPLMGSLEFHLPSPGIDPYFGAAGGWEFLNVRVRDFSTGIDYEADYNGPGYQLFAGVGLPVGPRAKLNAEAYWNGSTVKRNVYDPSTGFLVEERVKVDGGGGRAGLSFAF
jgi:hypothetical protein